MKRQHHGRIIETSVRLRTSPQKAWEAWADPQQIANWFVDRASGEAKAGATMKWFFDTFGYALDVPIAEAEPGRTFVSGGVDHPGPDGIPYLMEITINKDGDETVMHLVNSGFSTDPKKDDDFNGVVSGWAAALARLKLWIEHYPLRTRHHNLVVRPADFTWEGLRPFYATAGARARWMEPDVPAGGTVLCDTGAELLLALDDRDGAVDLKAFTMGPQKMVGLDLSVWPETSAFAPGASADRVEETRARLNRALDRLVILL
jgi:uncharacterized protein YndB with AHSA1/START domain